jgi:hypothetical protein
MKAAAWQRNGGINIGNGVSSRHPAARGATRGAGGGGGSGIYRRDIKLQSRLSRNRRRAVTRHHSTYAAFHRSSLTRLRLRRGRLTR